ncbi:MAG: glycosyltransferase family 39 protein [Clostridiales bacterium]|nr:glycosyltransferase family 39 protein [Clostridiales bacterium]MDY4008700.1 glycosyltransferase family 39 protein [Candidatus Limiplasma sp.]
MSLSPRARRGVCVFLYSLAIALAVLFFCSKSSPGYPINDWCDANIYLTIGKGMTRGQVVYRDLYDHKGPLLYALHALCALVSFRDFTGVYLMEALLAAAFLCGAYRLLSLYGARRAAWLALPVAALLIYTSYSFSEGDSAEELCLPLLVWSIYIVLVFFRSGRPRMRRGALMGLGALAGCVLWIKFTIIGLQAGLVLALLLHHALSRQWREAFRAIGWLFVGFGLSTLPWIVYFGLNGAIGDWFRVYLYDNLFKYSSGVQFSSRLDRIQTVFGCGWSWLTANLRYTLVLLFGLGWFALRRKLSASERMGVWLAAALGAMSIFIGGINFPYYGLALAALVPLGFIAPANWLEACLGTLSVRGRAALAAAACAAGVALCVPLSYNMNADYGAAFGQPREQTMQYRIAAHIPPNATLLNYGFMDSGFYTAAGLVPNVLYFHQNNVPISEMPREQARYIAEGVCDYVVARIPDPPDIGLHYRLAATVESPNFWYENVYLFQKVR